MKNSKILKTALLLNTLILVSVGGRLFFFPEKAISDQEIGIINVNLLNNYRGLGGFLIACSIAIFLGVIRSSMVFTSTLIVMFTMLGSGLGRLSSLMFDGIPVKMLAISTVLEMFCGLSALFALIKYRGRE